MENNWKGSKGDFGWVEQFDENIFDIISDKGLVIARDIEGLEDAQMFSDAIKVRQQIDCSLPELLERCKRAEDTLTTIETLCDSQNSSHEDIWRAAFKNLSKNY